MPLIIVHRESRARPQQPLTGAEVEDVSQVSRKQFNDEEDVFVRTCAVVDQQAVLLYSFELETNLQYVPCNGYKYIYIYKNLMVIIIM